MSKYWAPIVGFLMMVAFAASASAQGMSYSYSHWYRGNGPWWESPEQNVRRSARYDHLLQVSLRFRRYRMWKECHSIEDARLHADCIASFDQFEPVLPGAHWGWGWGYHHRHHWYHRHW
ncbi:MAG: hypothetical protein JO267_05735 [Alphaproteobacteria bacterium]|nr:hypothetical protein [Alphaproteobacteria bacterium]